MKTMDCVVNYQPCVTCGQQILAKSQEKGQRINASP